ncbi:ABC transporter permease [Bifidobacterium longum]|uniref:ABC transporter permease n=1 Tax=Bifidobacterium longum TaxID=216816 RepID=UPI00067B3214|nr:ABC transporter permease [Bifidobacterium longum]
MSVTASADLSKARNTTNDSLTTLGLMIGVIALAVGGMSIANMMIVTVMERRGEIGLRRALGATPGNIRMQFVTEAALLSTLGGFAGIALGAGAAIGVAASAGQPIALDWTSLPLAWAAAILVGILAGLYPASPRRPSHPDRGPARRIGATAGVNDHHECAASMSLLLHMMTCAVKVTYWCWAGESTRGAGGVWFAAIG